MKPEKQSAKFEWCVDKVSDELEMSVRAAKATVLLSCVKVPLWEKRESVYRHPTVNSDTDGLFEPMFLGGSAGRGHDEQEGTDTSSYRPSLTRTTATNLLVHPAGRLQSACETSLGPSRSMNVRKSLKWLCGWRRLQKALSYSRTALNKNASTYCLSPSVQLISVMMMNVCLCCHGDVLPTDVRSHCVLGMMVEAVRLVGLAAGVRERSNFVLLLLFVNSTA